MSLRIAIDTGGTFTDVVAIDDANGRQFVIKTPSTPQDPSIGLLDGVSKVLEIADLKPSNVGQLLHGSTTATNAVLWGTGGLDDELPMVSSFRIVFLLCILVSRLSRKWITVLRYRFLNDTC